MSLTTTVVAAACPKSDKIVSLPHWFLLLRVTKGYSTITGPTTIVSFLSRVFSLPNLTCLVFWYHRYCQALGLPSLLFFEPFNIVFLTQPKPHDPSLYSFTNTLYSLPGFPLSHLPQLHLVKILRQEFCVNSLFGRWPPETLMKEKSEAQKGNEIVCKDNHQWF